MSRRLDPRIAQQLRDQQAPPPRRPLWRFPTLPVFLILALVVCVVVVFSILGGAAGKGRRSPDGGATEPQASPPAGGTPPEQTVAQALSPAAAPAPAPAPAPAQPSYDASLTYVVAAAAINAARNSVANGTEAQQAAAWETLNGRRVCWPGFVCQVEPPALDVCTVKIQCAAPEPREGYPQYFPDVDFAVPPALGLQLQKGQRVTVEGTIDRSSLKEGTIVFDNTIRVGNELLPLANWTRVYKIGFHLEGVALQQTR